MFSNYFLNHWLELNTLTNFSQWPQSHILSYIINFTNLAYFIKNLNNPDHSVNHLHQKQAVTPESNTLISGQLRPWESALTCSPQHQGPFTLSTVLFTLPVLGTKQVTTLKTVSLLWPYIPSRRRCACAVAARGPLHSINNNITRRISAVYADIITSSPTFENDAPASLPTSTTCTRFYFTYLTIYMLIATLKIPITLLHRHKFYTTTLTFIKNIT